MIPSKVHVMVTLLLLTAIFKISSQEASSPETSRPDPDRIHATGLAYSQTYKTLESMYADESEELHYSISSVGLNYSSFTGGRLGFVSDMNLCIPILTSFESVTKNGAGGFSLGYLGGIGWNLKLGRVGVQPYTGFHFNYMLLFEDPIDHDMSNHLITFGLGGGSRVFYRMQKKHHIYLGMTLFVDTIEFSSASYDSRKIKLLYSLSYSISAGYAWSL